MFAPEKTQTDICLLKKNLNEIETKVINQRTRLAKCNAENNKKYRETIRARDNLRSMTAELERLNHESVQLTAQRAQLQQKTDEISENLTAACEERDKLKKALEQLQQEILDHIRKYEDVLQERAEQFRKSHRFYNEEEINKEINEINTVIAELKDGMSKKQSAVDGLRAQMDAILPELAENLLEQIGKSKLEEQLQIVSEKHEELQKKQKL